MSPSPTSTAAIVFPAVGEVELRDVSLPTMGPDDVLVEVEHTTISAGTELHCLHGTIRLGAGTVRFPFTPGYQAAGRVRAAGDAVTEIAVGDRVFSARCKQPPGWEGGWWAGHCAWHVAAAADVISLPSAVDTRSASALLLAQVGYNGGARPPVAAGDAALVIGDGLVGQWAAQVLRHRGARVLLAGHRRRRLEIAAEHSADEVVDTHAEDLGEWVRSRARQACASRRRPRGRPISSATLQPCWYTTVILSSWVTIRRAPARLTSTGCGRERPRPTSRTASGVTGWSGRSP